MANYKKSSNVKKNRNGNKAPTTYQARKGERDGKGVPHLTKPCDMDSLHSNDVTWYNKYSNDFNLATRAPAWWKVYGDKTNIGKSVNLSNLPDITLPVGMRIQTMIGPGTCSEPTDSVNRAFTVLMSDLYAKSSSSSLPFQQADLANITLCVDSVSSFIAMAKRALSMTSNWLTTNKYYPIYVERMLGFDYQDLIRSKANYVVRLNAIIHRFNSLRFPVKFDILKRHYALFSNVYADEDSSFAQLYAFVARNYYLYDDETGSAKFNVMEFGSSAIAMDHFLNVVQSMLDAIMNSSDFYSINGALQRAYGDSEFASITEMSMDSVVTPIVDRNIMLQVMNADVSGYIYSGETSITQAPDKNSIIWRPLVAKDIAELTGVNKVQYVVEEGANHFMRAYDETLSNDDNMEMTRLACTYFTQLNESTKKVEVFIQCGTEFVWSVDACGFQPGTNTYAEVSITSNILDASKVQTSQDVLRTFSPFRYAPKIIIGQLNGDASEMTGMWLLGDLYNYTELANRDLNMLTRVALDSIWKPL